MAFTKLMNIKEAKRGTPYAHLKNSIDYILDVKHGGAKTDYGRLVGGNSGIGAQDILNQMLSTKQDFDKPNGRQGYHFVIAFPPDVATPEQTMEAAQKFCERYLGDNYEYVFAVHIDKAHTHAHVVFNSVSRVDGLKYHYKRGDWEQFIQPVTDEICTEMELPTFEVADVLDEEQPDYSHMEWSEKKEGKINKRTIFRADIDYAVQHSKDMPEFKYQMSQMGYMIRTGNLKDYGEYMTFTFVGDDGKKTSIRSRSLGKGYSPKEIESRILSKEGPKTYEVLTEKLTLKVQMSLSYRGRAVVKDRLLAAAGYYRLKNPFAVPPQRVRRDILQIDRLLEECSYLKKYDGVPGAYDRKQDLDAFIKRLYRQIDDINAIDASLSEEERMLAARYKSLHRKLDACIKAGDDSQAEKIEDEMSDIEGRFPPGTLDKLNGLPALQSRLSDARKERRILDRIIKEEGYVPEQSLGQEITQPQVVNITELR